MVDQKKVEQYFDVLNEACVYLFENCKYDYMTSLLAITDSIFNGDITFDLDNSLVDGFVHIMKKLDQGYNQEEVRKALQFLILNALKETKNINTITPDTIAFIFNYFVDKIFKDKEITILDPLVGSANLLAAIGNNHQNCQLYGIDDDELMIKLASMMSNMVNLDMTFYNQDTFMVRVSNVDLIVSDVINDVDFTYKFINHYKNVLKDDGYMILLINNEFFNTDSELKNEINQEMSMLGLIELPNEFFVGTKKSIVLMKKTSKRVKEFLLATMPSVKDMGALNDFLSQIEQWFKKESI